MNECYSANPTTAEILAKRQTLTGVVHEETRAFS